MVNKRILYYSDSPVELKNKSAINIGNESLCFYLPKTEQDLKEWFYNKLFINYKILTCYNVITQFYTSLIF